jgi:hypothetical protein
MQVDAFGKIEESRVKITDVKPDKDLSAIVYDHFSNNRNRFQGRGNYNQNQSVADTVSVNTFLSSQVGNSEIGINN